MGKYFILNLSTYILYIIPKEGCTTFEVKHIMQLSIVNKKIFVKSKNVDNSMAQKIRKWGLKNVRFWASFLRIVLFCFRGGGGGS